MKAVNVLAGFVVGAAVGAALVLLLTPRSGAEIQQAIQDRAQAALEQGQEAAEMRRLELTERLESLKQPPASTAG